MDKEFLKIIHSDLEYITQEWNAKDISDANLRRSSNILRRLLIDQDLFRAARLFGFRKLRVLISDEMFPFFPNPTIYQAGGGKYNNMEKKDLVCIIKH